MTSLLNNFREREFIQDASNFEALKCVLEGERISFYCGFDPTADSLHVGSMLPLILMRRMQLAGHKPIALLGSATGMIGDPSGKSLERQLLSDEQIKENLIGIEQQISLFLSDTGDNSFEIVRNDEWLGKLSLIDYLRDVGKHFSVNAMILKDSVKSRLENREQGISYTEFSYQILQAYDFYWLYKNKGCRLQVGGSDQWGNITAGIDLIRRKTGSDSAKAFGMTFPLLTTSSGAKFGKTEKGAVWLSPEKTSPYRFYQYWVNTEDSDVIRYLNLFTETDIKELERLKTSVSQRPQEREAQALLARSLTELVHGSGETERAISAGKILFGGKIDNIDEQTLQDIFSDVPSTTISPESFSSGMSIIDILLHCKIIKSKGEGRRSIEGGGIYLNNERVTDASLVVSNSHLVTGDKLIFRAGKKRYHLVSVA